MKLIQLGSLKWRVLAVCDRRGRCDVLDTLRSMAGHGGKKMLATLTEYIPEHGPNFGNREKVKHLADDIWELREQPRKGPKPRVYFFRDGEFVVVATQAYEKRNETATPFIERARLVRAQYRRDKKSGLIEIEELRVRRRSTVE